MKRAALVGASIGLACVSAAADVHADDKACMAAATSGQERRDEGKLLEARDLFVTCADASCPAPIPGYCADWLADLRKKLPSLVLRAVDATGRDVTDASAEIDGKAVALDGRPVEVDPGRHTVRFTRATGPAFEDTLIVAQGEKDRVVIGKLAAEEQPVASAPPAPAPASEPARVPLGSWVGWGVGAVALGSFGFFALKARSDYDDFESTCGTRCTGDQRDQVATSVTVADVSLVVGLVAAAVGTVLYLTRPTASATSATAATSATWVAR